MGCRKLKEREMISVETRGEKMLLKNVVEHSNIPRVAETRLGRRNKRAKG